MSDSKRILAVSSGGGHWVELMRLRPAFEGHDVAFVTVNREYREEVAGHRFYKVNDATRWNKFAVLRMAFRVLLIVLRERPDVVITTGAAPGHFALRFGKWWRCKTVWLDSIANVDELSMSGKMSGRFADLWLTQWEHLAKPQAAETTGRVFRGAVLSIFVTVGHQMSFDRLVRAVDDWARRNQRSDVFAQIGKTDYRPAHIKFQQFLSPTEFDHRMREATGIVAHAGTGTIIAAAQLGKPLLVMPRLARLEETRNDHQVPTMKHFADRGYVLAASDERELAARMIELEGFRPRATIGGAASDQLIAALRGFILS